MPMRDELIQRAIQQLAKTFAMILSRQGEIGRVEADVLRAEMEALYPAFLGTSAALLRRLSTEDILGVLRTAGYVDGERAYLLGALFEAEAELVLAEALALDGASSGDPTESEVNESAFAEAASLRLRALDLVLEAGIEELGEPDIPVRVERLRAAVAPLQRSATSWERLHRYLAGSGAYAQAEDALFAWATALAADEAVGDSLSVGGTAVDDSAWRYLSEVGGTFYRALSELEDAALTAGELPREEVEEGKLAFEERLAELRAA